MCVDRRPQSHLVFLALNQQELDVGPLGRQLGHVGEERFAALAPGGVELPGAVVGGDRGGVKERECDSRQDRDGSTSASALAQSQRLARH